MHNEISDNLNRLLIVDGDARSTKVAAELARGMGFSVASADQESELLPLVEQVVVVPRDSVADAGHPLGDLGEGRWHLDLDERDGELGVGCLMIGIGFFAPNEMIKIRTPSSWARSIVKLQPCVKDQSHPLCCGYGPTRYF